MTSTTETPSPTTIVFGTDGWRARIADDYTFENVRRCADGVAHYVESRGEQAKGVVIAFDRRFASEHFAAAAAEVVLAHGIPVALAQHAVPTQMSSYEVVQRGCGRRHRHHRQPQPLGRQRLQGQGADRARPPGRRSSRPSRSGSPRTAATPWTAGRSPTPRRPGWSTASIRSRATSGSSARHDRPRRPEGRRRPRPRRPDVGRRVRLDQPAAGRREDPGDRDPPGAQPVLRRRQPGADPAQRRRGARDARRRRLRPRPAPRRRRRPGRRGRRARHVHPPAPGHRAADVLPRRASRPARSGGHQRQQHVDGGAARGALRDPGLRDAGRVQVHRAEDDRDRRDDGRRGVRRLRLRDAPARARRHLRRPAAARPVPPREGRGTVAGVEGDRALPRDRGRVVLPADGRPHRAQRCTPRPSAGCWSTCASRRRPSWPARP